MNGDDRGFMVVELSERSHDDGGLELFQARRDETRSLKCLNNFSLDLFFTLREQKIKIRSVGMDVLSRFYSTTPGWLPLIEQRAPEQQSNRS